MPNKSAEGRAGNKKNGLYGTLGLGINWLQTVSGYAPATSFAGVDYRINTTAEFNTGIAEEVGLGYEFGDVRTEPSYIHNNQSMRDINARLIQKTISTELKPN